MPGRQSLLLSAVALLLAASSASAQFAPPSRLSHSGAAPLHYSATPFYTARPHYTTAGHYYTGGMYLEGTHHHAHLQGDCQCDTRRGHHLWSPGAVHPPAVRSVGHRFGASAACCPTPAPACAAPTACGCQTTSACGCRQLCTGDRLDKFAPVLALRAAYNGVTALLPCRDACGCQSCGCNTTPSCGCGAPAGEMMPPRPPVDTEDPFRDDPVSRTGAGLRAVRFGR